MGAEVAAHRLEFDAAQLDAARRLDRLSADLFEASQSIGGRLREHLRWLPLSSTAASPQRGLYLWGGVGRGKTMLMDWFYESLSSARRERTHFYRFMRKVHAELRGAARRTQPLESVAQRIAQRARVICLDEFFVADIADAMILAGLFDGLFRRGVTLIATSNIPLQDLYKDGLQRERFQPAIELIRNHVEVVNLDGGIDYRLRQLEQAPTYLDSTRERTSAELRQRFAALAGGSAAGPSVLSVEDRNIAALATGAGMAWFEFSELCEGPRSQNDYIELARSYHTVFISNVPKFTEGDEDAARRFIMLIDEFYDRGVKIVVSAAAPPAALYGGERLQLEFQRAASRLVEMQTQHYLAGQHRP
ncbi:MAG TPA: cell division protein ZapE [Steroidobacteraceae bacterium]|nr:cell division protein ZapE [Steroidobacteraceae bacterium]